MPDYPQWVLKHKTKGTYINYQNGKYYLYAAHSERIPGTKKVRRVSDGYLGRITEKDGLIPPRDKVSGDVIVYEYGLSATIVCLCSRIHSGLRRRFKNNGDFIMSAAVLSVIHGHYNQRLFEHSFLCVLYPDVSLDQRLTDTQTTALTRTILMIRDTLESHFREDLPLIMETFPFIHKIKINQRFYTEKLSDMVTELKDKYHITWED